MTHRICIAVDGPGSSGKGTIARAVAHQLGYSYIDTGAMYRAVALEALQHDIDWDDEPALAAITRRLVFDFRWDGEVLRVLLDGVDVTRDLRRDAMSTGASRVSRHAAVREALLGRQRDLAARGGVVMDGRDIGTVVLPNAELKVYLEADLDERARRRWEELVRRGDAVHYATVREALEHRDKRDRERDIAPLRPADDAVTIDTTHLTVPQATEAVLHLVEQRLTALDG
jgi:cytidylate kinase